MATQARTIGTLGVFHAETDTLKVYDECAIIQFTANEVAEGIHAVCSS